MQTLKTRLDSIGLKYRLKHSIKFIDGRQFSSPSQYYDYLAGFSEHESPIPGEFINDGKLIWFVSGGNQCVGLSFCNWHSDMDAIYAVGSSTIANVGVPKRVLREAIRLLERIKTDNVYDNIERLWLIELGKAALASKPSDDIQYVNE